MRGLVIQWPLIIIITLMQSLTNKMRELAIKDLKNRRELIFEKTRRLFEMKQLPPQFATDSVVETQNQQEQQLESEMVQPVQKMEVEERNFIKNLQNKKKQKDSNSIDKIKNYWRQMLQVNDWLVSIPENLQQYFVASRPDGTKCLMIFTYNLIELTDKSGSLIASFNNPVHNLSGTVIEAYYLKEEKKIVMADLIVWKTQTFASSQFDFRTSWLYSNVNKDLAILSKQVKIQFLFVCYNLCTLKNLQTIYMQESQYKRDGLLFVYSQSFYEPGHNPNSLIWKDHHTSPYFQHDLEFNSKMSKGVGYINKEGEVKSLQNKTLFMLDRSKIGRRVRFVKFNYQNIELRQDIEGNIGIKLLGLQNIETIRTFEGRVDSLGKLYYKCSLKHRQFWIESFAQILK